MPEYPTKRTSEDSLLFRSAMPLDLEPLVSRLLAGGSDETLVSQLAFVGCRILESGSDTFESWRERMVGEFGDPIKAQIWEIWRSLPTRAHQTWDEAVSEGVTQKQRVVLLFAYRNFVEKWKSANIGERERTSGRDEADPRSTEDEADYHPSQYEQQLMTYLQFQSPQELVEFLNGPSHPEFLKQTKVPDELYELTRKEYEADEEVAEVQREVQPTGRGRRVVRLETLWIMCVISTVLVIVGLSRLPYGYYMLLRLFLCAHAAYGFSKALDNSDRAWMWIFGLAAVLYNPFFPIRLHEKSLWSAINMVTLVVYWLGTAYLQKSRKKLRQETI